MCLLVVVATAVSWGLDNKTPIPTQLPSKAQHGMRLVFNTLTTVWCPVTSQCHYMPSATTCHVTRQVTMPSLFLSLVMRGAPRPGLPRQDDKAGWFPRHES